ncbi:MAG: phospho-sugar mutase, partial [Proteobacteria bacterium]|nr:phospho-sugar mutase [Pseudomonadota bacterium]
GFRVFFWEHPCPTPLVPFALLRVGAAAGVMVTASHNPPSYNGYKAYWENGAQLIPPHDEGIAAEIARTGPAKAIRTLLPPSIGRAPLLETPMLEAPLGHTGVPPASSGGVPSTPVVHTGGAATGSAKVSASSSGVPLCPGGAASSGVPPAGSGVLPGSSGVPPGGGSGGPITREEEGGAGGAEGGAVGWSYLGEEMAAAYREWALGLRIRGEAAPLRVAYTAMHGVGTPWVEGLLGEAGYGAPHRVEAQCTPDAAFPTLSFPNPEEPGALDLAMEVVEACQADLLLANDPDADRLSVGARDARGKFRMFSGNELGVMLGHYLLTQRAWSKPLLLSTVVSTSLFGRMCKALGARYEETLTGFKWIANRALELERKEACEFVFGFEEALGYCAGTAIRDKDGISIALLAADLASHCAAQGQTLVDYLEQIFRRFGFHASRQKSLTFPGGESMQKIFAFMDGLRKSPPWKLGESRVVSISDYQTGLCVVGTESTQLGLPSSNLVAFVLERGHRVLVRPSGTEPKVKVYIEWCEPLCGAESLECAALRAQEGLLRLERDLLQQWFSPSPECI